MIQRIINIYEYLYNTKYNKYDENIKIMYIINLSLQVNNKHIITLYSHDKYFLHNLHEKYFEYNCFTYAHYLSYYNNKNIIINKCNNHYKQIIKYIMYTNKYNFIGIIKTYNNNKINNKNITMSNNNIRYKLLYVLYYKYNYYYYILNSKQHKTNILIININIIKNYFLLYIIFVY